MRRVEARAQIDVGASGRETHRHTGSDEASEASPREAREVPRRQASSGRRSSEGLRELQVPTGLAGERERQHEYDDRDESQKLGAGEGHGTSPHRDPRSAVAPATRAIPVSRSHSPSGIACSRATITSDTDSSRSISS